MKHISSIKPNVEKGLYGLVKRPDAKTPDLSELSKTIKKFQDTPDINFTSKLRKRVPSNNSYKLESKDDFGLSKRFKSGSLTKVENPDASAKIVDGRFSDKIKPFKISEGITGLNKQFQKVIPKTDYSYTDPQYYEYKLKGQTIKDQQLNAFKNQNEDDIDKLDIQGKYKKWREEDLGNKATKIQKLFRGRSVREDLGEGRRLLDETPEQEARNVTAKDVIIAGKARRKEKISNLVDENTIKNRNAKTLQNFAKNIQAKKIAKEADIKQEIENNKQLEKQRERQEFMARSGIDEYSNQGQLTKQRKKQAKQEAENERNNKALKIQKVFRGKQSRQQNDKYADENVKRHITPNPDYDPSIADPNDPKSHKNIYYKPQVTTKESKIIKYDRAVAKQARESTARKEERQRRREEVDRERRMEEAEPKALFIDEDERTLQEKLSKAYPKKAPKEKKDEVTKETDPRKLAWLKKQDELNERSKYEQEEERQHQQHSTDIDNYRALTELLGSSKGGKTTAEMNKLIPSVYRAFGKNAGTNTNRSVKTVINQLEMWQAEKDSKAEKIAAYNAQLSAKKAKAQKAKIADAKRRVPPSTSTTVHTLESLKANEEKGGGGRVYNMDNTNQNKTNLIPQAPKKAEGKSGKK